MKKNTVNRTELYFSAKSENEGFARSAASLFVSQLDPTIEEISDIRTVVSEAVTNAVVHGYRGCDPEKSEIYLELKLYDDRSVRIKVRDRGCGIEDIEKARRPLFSTDTTGERGGMGFSIMESFTDRLKIVSSPGKGTLLTMVKKLKD